MRFEFRTFCAFYMVAFMLDATEEWDPAVLALLSVALVVLVYLRGVKRWEFLAFLVASSAYILVVHFPDPGNHNNLFLFLNIFLAAVILWASRRPHDVPDDDSLLEKVKPTLRVTISFVYIFAGFHKLNEGFFEENVGCAATFFDGIWSQTPLPDASLSGLTLVLFGASIILWELGGGMMLWFRRTQPVMLAMALVGHSVLAMLEFVDFSSLAMALLLTYIPPAYWRVMERESTLIGWRGRRIDRTTAYVLINVAVALAAGAFIQVSGVSIRVHQVQGLGFIFALAIFVWPILAHQIRGRPRIAWEGVPMGLARIAPRWAVVLPVFILFFGLNPYLGLRTAGTFTMFSNLQTEGETSNHLLLGGQPLKIWDLQDDVVHVRAIDPRHTDKEVGDLNGNSIPTIEFKKMIVEWGNQGLDGLDATYEHDGRVYETRDLVADNPWGIEGYTLGQYLVDFRLIQENGPLRCRW
jgi:hypothetical protein